MTLRQHQILLGSGRLLSTEKYEDVVLATPGLMRYWPLNDAFGSTTIAEATGVGGVSTVTNTIVLNTASIVPGSTMTCGDFDGVAGAITQDSTRGLDLSTLAGWSMMAWINPDVIPAAGAHAGIIGSVNDNGFAMHLTGNQLSGSQTDLRGPTANSTATLSPGQLYQVGKVYHKSTRVISWFVNGVASGTATYGGDPANGLRSGSIGTRTQGSESNWFNGRIAHVQLYNLELVAADYLAHYKAGIGPISAAFRDAREHFGPF